MAASSRGIRDKSEAKSAFDTPQKGQKEKRSWLDPPIVSVTPYATVGLQSLYTQVHKKEPFLDNDTNDFTDENGVFCPKTNMPLLARRYRFVESIGSGVSSITICAQDTFHPDQDKVAIKILNVSYYRLGYQESSSMRQLNKADPDDFSGTLRLLNIFSFSGHFCMVFELLHPKPLHHYFRRMDNSQEKLRWIRRVTIRLLQVLGFLQQENVIHADLKPENVLCKSDDLSSGIKVIDFGNAIHCVYDELSLYYDDFELQTLLYRAPEVLYGLPFGLEIDMWSLGCILAELYIGKPLFYAMTKEKLLQKMVSVLGPLPSNLLQRGKFYQEYSSYTGKSQSSLVTWAKLHTELLGVSDPHFVSFIAAMLQYNPSDRISVWDAFQHPFLAPEIAVRYLLPPSQTDQKKNYPQIGISSQSYNLSPLVSSKIAKDRLSTVDMLRRGTSADTSDTRPGFIRGLKSSNGKAIAEVTPFVNQQRDHRTHIPAFQVQPQHQQQSRVSNEVSHRHPAFQVPPPVIASTAEVPLQFSLGKRMPKLKSNVRKPVAVPGKFASMISEEKQDGQSLPRDSSSHAYLQHSSHMHQIGALISEELQHEDLSSIPSTSTYQRTQSKTSGNRTVFPNEIIPSNPRGDTSKMSIQRNVTETPEDPNQEELVQSSQVDSEGSRSNRKSTDMDRRVVPLQKGEIFLTKVESEDFPRMAKTNPKQASGRSTSRSERSPSPMSRWNNLEKMRSEALRKNKKEVKQQNQVKKSDGNKILNSTSATIKTEKTSPELKLNTVDSAEGVPSSDKVSAVLHSPLGTNQASLPTTPSHKTASISKLRCRTPVTPSDSTVLLVSEFPTPDDNTKFTPGKHKSQSSPASSSDEGSAEVGERKRRITTAVKVEDEDSDDDSRESWESGGVTRQETEVVTTVIDNADEGLVNNGCVVKKEQIAKETGEASSRTKMGTKLNRGRKRKIHQELQKADNLKTKAGSGRKKAKRNSPKIVKRSINVSAKKSVNTQNSPSTSIGRSGKGPRKRTPTLKKTSSSEKRGKQSKPSKITNVNKKTVPTPKQNRSKKTSVGGNSRKVTPSHDPKHKAPSTPTLTKKKRERPKQGKSKQSSAKKPKQRKSKSSPTNTIQKKVSAQRKAQDCDRRQAKAKAADQIADIYEFESDVPSIDDRDYSSDGSSYESGPIDDLQSEDQLDYDDDDDDEELWQDDQLQKNSNGCIQKDDQVEASHVDAAEKEEDQMEEDEVLLL